MPLFDLPLEKLKTYMGTNPRPDDFDQYWERALAEMRAMDGKVELRPAEFKVPFAECFDLFFTGVRGARIYAKYLRPKNAARPHPAIIRFHGYSGNSGDWSDNLKYVALGFSVAFMDCRGQGGLSEDVGGVKGNTLRGQIIRGLDDDKDNLLFRHIFLDTAQLAYIVMDMPEVDRHRIGVEGGSQGGGLALACAGLVPEVKRVCVQFPFLSDYKRVWDLDLAKDAYEELKLYFRRFDPRHERENEVFTRLGYIDVQNLAGRIKGEVLFFTGLMDTVCPPSTQFAAYNKINSPKHMLIYPDYAHEGYPDYSDKALEFLAAL